MCYSKKLVLKGGDCMVGQILEKKWKGENNEIKKLILDDFCFFFIFVFVIDVSGECCYLSW